MRRSSGKQVSCVMFGESGENIDTIDGLFFIRNYLHLLIPVVAKLRNFCICLNLNWFYLVMSVTLLVECFVCRYSVFFFFSSFF
jgi:hypothetical protein